MKIKNTAFTLIELLVVIVIISILATISVATFQGYFEKARMAKAKAMAVQMQRLFLAQNASTEKNLVTAWYGFDGDGDVNTSNPYLIDKSGSGNNATAGDGSCDYSQDEETPMETGKSLKTNKCKFQRGPYNAADYPRKKITMAMWIKVSSFGSFMTYPLWVYGKNLFEIHKNGRVDFRLYTAGGRARSADGIIDPYKWHYIVGSYDGETVRLFVDGDLVAIAENVSVSDDFFSDRNIIVGYSSGGYAFDGYLDEIMIINYGFDGKELK